MGGWGGGGGFRYFTVFALRFMYNILDYESVILNGGQIEDEKRFE